MQKDIIESVLSGQDTLGIMPTGGGKSLTFQIPGLVLDGITIVVTPLISLMKDQVDNLRRKRIRALYLHSGMTMREKNIARDRLLNDKVKFLYISPERLSHEPFQREIGSLKVNLIVVDEAHCISQWGHDFRPSYLNVKIARKLFQKVPVLALTASATKEVEADICKQLDFKKDCKVFRQSIERDNLSYVVRNSDGKLFDILNILNSVPGSGIIYVRSRKKTREIAEYLNNCGISASFYHAGISPELKEMRQNLWKENTIRIMVATNAFGMGIDKSDVRLVIHYDLPPSLEEYYQEAGRAGRDGKKAYAVLLRAKSDNAVLRRRLTMEFPDKEIIKNIYTRACVFSNIAIGEGYDRAIEFDIAKFCETFHLHEAVVRPSLRILGHASYLNFIEEIENSSRIMIIVDREELYKVKFSSCIQERILTVLLRNYPGLFTDYVFINESKIAFLSKTDAPTVYQSLVELSKSKIIHYIPRRKTPLLYLPTAREEEERHITIGKAVYENRREILKKRIEAMIDYAEAESECRLITMQKYFGETEMNNCGHCDICLKNKKEKKIKVKDKDVSANLYKLFSENENVVSDKQLEKALGMNYPLAVDILRRMEREDVAIYKNGIWFLR